MISLLKNFLILVVILVGSYPAICEILPPDQQSIQEIPHKIDGITLEAPPRSVNGEWATAMTQLGADWVAIVPYAFCAADEDRLRFPTPDSSWRWWGEHPQGVIENIRQARAAGMKIMLKPQIWIRGKWAGDYKPADPTAWAAWEKDYRAYLAIYKQIAVDYDVELFCLGTELRHSFIDRPDFWREQITDFRHSYQGGLTVAANWDDYHLVNFWQELDYIGVDAYFPLSDEDNPTTETLLSAWEPIKNQLAGFSSEKQRPVLFAEFGYRSIDQTTWNHWEKDDLSQWPANQEAQATALEALFAAFWGEPWFAGGFLWKWHADPTSQRRSIEKRFTPQGKAATGTIRATYSMNPAPRAVSPIPSVGIPAK